MSDNEYDFLKEDIHSRENSNQNQIIDENMDQFQDPNNLNFGSENVFSEHNKDDPLKSCKKSTNYESDK